MSFFNVYLTRRPSNPRSLHLWAGPLGVHLWWPLWQSRLDWCAEWQKR